jgi:hypothetical protein
MGTPSLAFGVCHRYSSQCMKLLVQLQLLLDEVKNEAVIQLLMFAICRVKGYIHLSLPLPSRWTGGGLL